MWEAVGFISLRGCVSNWHSQASSQTQESCIFTLRRWSLKVLLPGPEEPKPSAHCGAWDCYCINRYSLKAAFSLPESHATHAADYVSPSSVKKDRCYFFRATGASSILARLFQPWKRERSPAFHASRSPGLLRSQSGRISLDTARRSRQRSTTDGRPQNQ
jgi:hypothetical protein